MSSNETLKILTGRLMGFSPKGIFSFISLLLVSSIFWSSPTFAMQLFVRGMTGITYILEVEPSDTVKEVKQKLEMKSGIPADDLSLRFFRDKVFFENDDTLAYYGIKKEDTIYYSLNLRGD